MSKRELRRNPLGEVIIFADIAEINETSSEEFFSSNERQTFHVSSWNSIAYNEQSRRTNGKLNCYTSKW